MENFNIIDWVIIAVLVICIGAVIFYIRREKKKGSKCIGCPHSGSCGSKTCNCDTGNKE